MKRWIASILVFGAVMLPWMETARAQPPPPDAPAPPVDAAAKDSAAPLAEQCLRLFDAGDYAGAYETISRAGALTTTPVLALAAGRCLEKLGRLPAASEKYLEASRATLDAGATPDQKQAKADAQKAYDALLPRIPSVTIALSAPAPDAIVMLDGRPLPAAMLGIQRAIDLGTHTVEVTRGGDKALHKWVTFVMKEAQSSRVVIQLDQAEPPPPSSLKRRWYGGPILVAVGISDAFLWGGLAGIYGSGNKQAGDVFFVLGALGRVFSGGVIHAAHGQWGAGAASVGLNMGLPVVGGLVGVLIGGGIGYAAEEDGHSSGSKATAGFVIGGSLGLLAGHAGATIIDTTMLAYDPPGRARKAQGPTFTLAPLLGAGRTGLGLSGQF